MERLIFIALVVFLIVMMVKIIQRVKRRRICFGESNINPYGRRQVLNTLPKKKRKP
ncbi:MAG: hypothetical protein KAK00_03150 [Nanoarchaeota archaeon]|nr:hypothetical protein [Nanoarchaeota archaeon]